ncbi:hypothetical protein [Streptomyces sp. NPDC051162]|uniref:hypothetical protein n=1 Tax=unclassified Streptomyces TaxID=2593676 RepID=UPI003415AA75
MPFIGSEPDRRATHAERGAHHLDRRPVLPRRAATDRGRFSADRTESLPHLGHGQLAMNTTEFLGASA